MPLNCPIGLIPFFALDACQDCPQYERDLDRCGWFYPRKPIVELLDTEERLARLERLLKMPEKPQLEAHRLPLKPRPKLAEGVKL